MLTHSLRVDALDDFLVSSLVLLRLLETLAASLIVVLDGSSSASSSVTSTSTSYSTTFVRSRSVCSNLPVLTLTYKAISITVRI